MVSLLAESFGNTVILEGNLKNTNSNIKKLIQSFLNKYVDTLFKLYNINKNLNMKSKSGDLFYSFPKSKKYIEVLENRGFVKTDDIYYEKYNYIFSCEEKGYYRKNEENFISEISLTNNNGIENIYSYFYKENYIIFYSNSNYSDFYFHLSDDYEILDFKIDKNNFIYLLYKIDNKTMLLSSHLSSPFIELNKDNSKINDECLNFNIELPNDSIELSHIEDFSFYILKNDLNLYCIEFEKLYYFEYDDKIYFNYIDSLEEYKDQFTSYEQIEWLQIYNNINIYGLNDFLIDGKNKLSSKYLKLFDDVLINKFDNTLNGGLNYYNYKNYGKTGEIEYKDYFVNYDSDNLHINGNFYYEKKKSKFKIVVKNKEILLFSLQNNKLIFEKKINTYNCKELYFCNLMFNIKKYSLDEDYVECIYVSNYDSYPFKSDMFIQKLKKIPNNYESIENIIENSTLSDNYIKKTNCIFDGTSIVFENFFNYQKNKFEYGNKVKDVNNNDIIDSSRIALFEFNNIHLTKNDKIYFRNKGVLNYSNIKNIKFDLINEKKYITEFWVKNQGKTLYFKNTETGVILTNNKFNSDYYLNIPYISDYINCNNKNYSNIQIEDTDDLSLELEYDKKILITDKYFLEPLFYKFFLETSSLEEFQLFDDNHNEINYLSEEFKNGYIIYFNQNLKNKYFYNLGENNKFNYIQPIKVWENIEINYYFDENNTIKFETPNNISSFKIKTTSYVNGNINIYLYNTIKGLTYRIQMSSSEINSKFDLDLEIDKIHIEYQGNKTDFIFVEESGDSIINNNKIIFFKKNRNDIVYLSSIVEDIEFDKIDFTKIKINTRYNIGESYSENKNGNFYINKPFKNSIPVFTNSDISEYETCIYINKMPSDDSFYNNNYKTPGNYYEIKNSDDVVINTTNINFKINEVKNG